MAGSAATIAIYSKRKLLGKPKRSVSLDFGSAFGDVANGARNAGRAKFNRGSKEHPMAIATRGCSMLSFIWRSLDEQRMLSTFAACVSKDTEQQIQMALC